MGGAKVSTYCSAECHASADGLYGYTALGCGRREFQTRAAGVDIHPVARPSGHAQTVSDGRAIDIQGAAPSEIEHEKAVHGPGGIEHLYFSDDSRADMTGGQYDRYRVWPFRGRGRGWHRDAGEARGLGIRCGAVAAGAGRGASCQKKLQIRSIGAFGRRSGGESGWAAVRQGRQDGAALVGKSSVEVSRRLHPPADYVLFP